MLKFLFHLKCFYVFPKSLFHLKCSRFEGTPIGCADFGVPFFPVSALTLGSPAGVGANFLFASRVKFFFGTAQGNMHDFKQLQN